MKIVNICSEANPFVKTGGLADVTFSLSKELAKTNDVFIILPLYNKVKALCLPLEKKDEIDVYLSWRYENSCIYSLKKCGITYFFLENKHYFERDNIYGYDDDGERFAFFSIAAIETLKKIKLIPDVIHVHDWQTGMIPIMLKETYREDFKETKTVLNIHNSAFLGTLDPYALGDLYNLPNYLFEYGGTRMSNKVSTLKAGITYADKIVAVSPTNRNEMLTPEGGNGLNNVLIYREYDFVGILNGIDYEEFNPEMDKYISKEFNVDNVFENKKVNKIELCKKLGLTNLDAPLFSLVSRVTWQKGMDLVIDAVHDIVYRGGNVILLGSGEEKYENAMNELHQKYPNQVAVYVGYSNELAHQIYASSDFFLMPSLFEPCGLGQMIAERYGTLPIVRRVGGLRDSVINYDGGNDNRSNGFGFDEYSSWALKETCAYAMETMKNTKVFKNLVKNAMNTDNSWVKSGKQYHDLYKLITGKE